jgi:hypothetical protein
VWQLEPQGVSRLLAKILARRTLAEFATVEPLSGIKTGFNEAYLIDSAAKDAIIASDPSSTTLLKPYLRGQDFSRWSADWAGWWMIVLRSSENFDWPWSDEGERAEAVFRKTYPAISDHLSKFRDALVSRQDQGRYWWELRSCAYWSTFDQPKIMYPEITWRAAWVIDSAGMLCNNTAYCLPSDDPWILASANAPISWWYAWRSAMHGKDEALRYIKEFVRGFPIPDPTDARRAETERTVNRLVELTRDQHGTQRSVLDWLQVEHELEKPSQKLQAPFELDSDAFVGEVKKARGRKNPLSAAALRGLRDEYERTIEPAKRLAAEALTLEHRLSDLVNAAYGLTPDDVALMWATAPPRMPFANTAPSR